MESAFIHPRQWFGAKSGDSRGVALVIHGLNNNPNSCDELCASLSQRGISSLRASLSGHYTGSLNLNEVSCGKWIADVQSAWDEARSRSGRGRLYCVSYSLGALLCLNALARGLISFDAMFLLAPPVALQPAAKLLPLLFPLAPLGLSLPSIAPKDVRIHRWTPLRAYRALWKARKGLRGKAAADRLAAVPAAIALDPRDEIVSIDGLRCWQHDMQLGHWQLLPVYSEGPGANFWRHLLISRQRLGEQAWNGLLDDIARFLLRA